MKPAGTSVDHGFPSAPDGSDKAPHCSDSRVLNVPPLLDICLMPSDQSNDNSKLVDCVKDHRECLECTHKIAGQLKVQALDIDFCFVDVDDTITQLSL